MRNEPVISNKELLAIRQEFDLTQQEFADLLGVGRETVWLWENGRRTAKGAIAKLARIYLKLFRLGIPVSEMRRHDIENSWLDRYIAR